MAEHEEKIREEVLEAIRAEVHVHLHLDAPIAINVSHTVSADDALKALFNTIREDIAKMDQSVQDAITQLQADVQQETTVEQSAVALIQGFAAQLAAAVAAASAAGATPEQLAQFDDLHTQITTSSQALAASVAAGTTPPAPAAPAATHA